MSPKISVRGRILKVRKKSWVAPIIVICMLLGIRIVLTQGSALAPFIYTIF